MCILGTAVYLRRGRRPDALSLLGVAFLLQVLIDPASAGSLSFMLSYSALAGILIAAAPVAGLLPFWIPPAVRLPLAVGVAAQLATAPLLAAVFGRIYPAGVCATLILSPLVMLLLYTGLVFVLWGAVGGAAAPAVFWQIEGILKEFARLLYRCARVIAGAAAEVPPLMTGAKGVTAAAVISAAVLTGLLAGSYAVSSRRSRKRRDETAAGLRFAEVDQPLSGRTQYRSPAPLWAELPDQPGSPGEDHRAA
jgi:competence protein ComEC